MKNRLKVLRAERDWTQGDLADRLLVSRQTINAIETGKYDPSLPLAFKIARIFERPIEEIAQPRQATTENHAGATANRDAATLNALERKHRRVQ